MNADDRKILKKMIDRDASRALSALRARKAQAIRNAKADVPVDLLRDDPRGICFAIQAELVDIGAKLEALRKLGYKLDDNTLAFRRYENGGYVTRTPTIRDVELTADHGEIVERAIAATFRPKLAAIEEAQAAALLNVVAQDLPLVRSEMEKLRQTILDVCGPLGSEE